MKKNLNYDKVILILFSLMLFVVIIMLGINIYSSFQFKENKKEMVEEIIKKTEDIKEEDTLGIDILENIDTKHYQKIDILNVEVSSFMAMNDNVSYDAKNLIDDDLSTFWVDDSPKRGVNEFINFDLKKSNISYVCIVIGAKNYFKDFNRPKQISIIVDNKIFDFILEDNSYIQYLSFPQNIVTDNLKIIINSLQDNRSTANTAISEIKIFGEKIN